MTTVNIYEDKNNDLAAVVFEDGQCSNYIPCPEIAAFDGDGFFEEARLGFPEALPYEYDILIGLTMTEAAARAEREGNLIAQVGETITVYPLRMSEVQREFFQIELGDGLWNEVLARASGGDGVQLDI